MKNRLTRFALIFFALFIMADDVFGILGGRRRTRRRTAAVVGTSVHAADSAQMAQSQQQAEAAQQEADEANREAEAAKQQAAAATSAPPLAATPAPAATPVPAPAATGGKLPMGMVVAALPPGCTAQPINGVQYYHDGNNYYRAVFQGNTLVYVTAQPK